MSDCRAYAVTHRALAALRQIVDASGGSVYLVLESDQPVRCVVEGLDREAVERLILRADLRPVGCPDAAPLSPPQSGRSHLRIA